MEKRYTGYLFLCLIIVFAAVLFAKDDQQLATDLHKAKMVFAEDGLSPQLIKFPEGSQPTVRTFLNDYRQYFNVADDIQFQSLRTTDDRIGTHHRYSQSYKGIEVIGAQYILHERNGSVWYANGNLVHNLDLNISPSISEESALAAALKLIDAREYMWQSEDREAFLKQEQKDDAASFYPRGKLLITAGAASLASENFRLVYRFDVYAAQPLGRYYVDVDAHSGAIVNKLSRIHDVDIAGSGASLYNGTVSMTVDQVSGSNYRLQENGNTVRGADIRTFDMNNGTNYNAATDITSSSPNGPWDDVGVSAHWGAEATYDYFFNDHGRNSLNDAGFTLLSYVHTNLIGFGYPNNVNAFWDGSRMTYGDGDGVNYFPLVCLDVVGHELTHGVTEFSSNLIYQGESGALNESFSDIFGNLVEFDKESPGLDNGIPAAKWRVGEDLTANGLGIRSMINPNEFGDPDTYQGSFWASTSGGDNGGVHTNSGVQNFWFYLLTEGGSGTSDNGYAYNVTGIGLTDAAAIAYHNNNAFLVSSSNYDAAKNGAIACAEALFGAGSQQALSTIEAWLAVGVGTVPQPPADYATLPYSTGFESGSLDNNWNTYTSAGVGRVQVTSANTPHSGSYHLTMDVTTNGNYSTQEGWLHLNLSGQSNVDLEFWWKDFSDETHAQDGVYFSDNGGTSFVKVQNLNGASYANNVWNNFTLDLDALASANGLSLSSTFIVKFQQYDNYAIATDGHAYDDISVTGGAANVPPTANANGHYSGTAGIAVSFSSAGSSDSDGSIVGYAWDFGDGGSSTAANPSHTYAAAGTYNVSLTVTDNGGATGNDNTTATISAPSNNPPTANANGPYSGTAGNAVSFSSAGSSDSDGSIVGYAWDFGDGGTSNAANPSHTYAAAGTYNISLTVTDNDGATGNDNTTATITTGGGGAWQVLTYDDFESGWGSYVDGGSDCRRSSRDAAYAHQGTYCARIRDNTSTSVFTYGSGVDVSGYDEIRVSFWYYPRSMDNSNEDFWVQYYDGSSWNTVASYARNIDFQNGSFYQVDDVIISSSSYNFPTNMQIRFRCDASGNSDWVYIDEVEVAARTLSAAPLLSNDFDINGGLEVVPERFDLRQNYPNPFNPTTTIELAVPEQSFVRLAIYDISGKLVRLLVNDQREPGHYQVTWNGRNTAGQPVASGMYLYRMTARDFVQTRRLMLLK